MTVAGLNQEQLRALEREALVVMRELGQLGLSYFSVALDASQKADGSLVSEADRALELRARERFRVLTPEFGFVGEEFGALARLVNHGHDRLSFRNEGRSRFSGLNDFEHALDERPMESLNLDTDTYWILDPIDGTINFLSQIPQWSILLALVSCGRPVLGVVAIPSLNEVFIASLGHGARYGKLFSENSSQHEVPLTVCRTGQSVGFAQALVSYSTSKTFAYRGIESFLPILQSQSRECRTHSDAFGYTRILTGGIDLMIDPLVAPYDVAALQILFDETPGAVLTSLQSHRGDSRFRMGSIVAGANEKIVAEFFKIYRQHLIATKHQYCQHPKVLSEPLAPEKFQPTFKLPQETGLSVHCGKIWARSLETAAAEFLTQYPDAVVEDLSILVGTRETASRAFSNGRNEGPPVLSGTTTFHIRAIVSGAAGLVTGTPDFELNPVQRIREALDSAWLQSKAEEPSRSENMLSSRDQLIAHVGQHPWKSIRFAEDFESVGGLIQNQHMLEHDPRLLSLKTRLNMSVEYRWQYFMDGSQQTFVTQVCRIATNATCAENGEKRTAYGRYLKNFSPDQETLRTDLQLHFSRVEHQSLALLPAALVPEIPEYDYLAVDADLLGLILHEAIGHAAEGDLIQTRASGFGQDGQMKELDVGPDWLDILIDGTLDNCGYLPVDAEGVVPRRKTLVRNGKLVDAIHTRHTAKRAGKIPDGCARVQSLHYPSLNRMTSIWVCPKISKPLEATESQLRWDDIPPQVIQDTLEKHGYLNGAHGVLLLSGWRGGTASCSNLEFRADVARVLHLKKGRPPTLMREANFTGIATECFRSAVDAFGPTLCRSIGTCGKDGQGVLTSDGGPAFMVFMPNSKVRVIGTGESEGEAK